MSRRLSALVGSILLLLLVIAPGAALAAKPDRDCAGTASGFVHVDRDGWWDASVEGFEDAGIPVYEADGTTFTVAFDAFAVSFGMADGAALEAFIRGEQWDGIDVNDNDFVCMRDMPNNPGTPAYIFNGIDDTSNARH